MQQNGGTFSPPLPHSTSIAYTLLISDFWETLHPAFSDHTSGVLMNKTERCLDGFLEDGQKVKIEERKLGFRFHGPNPDFII